MFSGMPAVSILCRVSAPFQESTFGIHEELFRGRKKSEDSKGRSDSYISPICGCWLSNAYKSEVPERHIPTTKTGPGFIGPEVSVALWFSALISTTVVMPPPGPARRFSSGYCSLVPDRTWSRLNAVRWHPCVRHPLGCPPSVESSVPIHRFCRPQIEGPSVRRPQCRAALRGAKQLQAWPPYTLPAP